MEKKWYLVSIVFLFILIIGSSILAYEYNKYRKNILLLEKGLELIQNDQLENGINKCNQMDYLNSICYRSVLGKKLYRIAKLNKTISEEITEDFCQSIPEDNQFPWWVIFTGDKANKQEAIKELKKHCFKTLNPEPIPNVNNPITINFEYNDNYKINNEIEIKQNKGSILQGGFLNTLSTTVDINIGIDKCSNLKSQQEINTPIEVISHDIKKIPEGETIQFKIWINTHLEDGDYRCNLIVYNSNSISEIYASKEFLLNVKK